MGAADPSYPLYPIACIIASALLLLVLTTSFVRQRWNLGVTFLCFWLFFENLTYALNAFIWSDNANIRLYVYCDIVTRLQIIAYIVKPMSTLIITRQLYMIASLQSVELSSAAARHRDFAVEWALGLILPILVAGPIYYINQGARFVVLEGFGCTNAPTTSILEYLIEESWTILAPLVSIVFYYPKVVRMYYRQRRDSSSSVLSSPWLLRTTFFRILVLASIDILLTLPFNIVNITLEITSSLSPGFHFSFYPGWTFVHSDWEPFSYPYSDNGTAQLALVYFSNWTSPVLAFVIFGLFGVTHEARASYWRIVCVIGRWFGWRPSSRARRGRASLGELEFNAPPQNESGFDLNLSLKTRPPSLVDTKSPDAECALRPRTSPESHVDLELTKRHHCENDSATGAEYVPTVQVPHHDFREPGLGHLKPLNVIRGGNVSRAICENDSSSFSEDASKAVDR